MKRLYKSRKDKVISGICGGIGEYFGIDPVLVRVIAVLLFFFGGVGVIAYIVGVIIIPVEPLQVDNNEKREIEKKEALKEKSSEYKHTDTGALIIGIVFLIAGFMFLMRNFNFFDFHFWWIRDQIRLFFWPGILVTLGVLLVFKGAKK